MIILNNAPGIVEAIEAAGYHVVIRFAADGTETAESSDDTAVQSIIDGYTVAEARDYLKLQLRMATSSQYDRGIESSYGYTPSNYESDGWIAKEAQANSYQDWVNGGSVGDAPATPALDPHVTASNTLADETAAVLAKAAALHGLEDAIKAWAQGKKDQINAATTFAELLAIDLQSGAPV